ncbi:MAG: hypothetical protein AB8G23_01750 [Myxococcota bacterium]
MFGSVASSPARLAHSLVQAALLVALTLSAVLAPTPAEARELSRSTAYATKQHVAFAERTDLGALQRATSLRRSGFRPSDVYLDLRNKGYTPQASAGSVVDVYTPASASEVAEAMWLDGVPLDEIVEFLRSNLLSVDEIWDILKEITNESEERILSVLVRLIAFGEGVSGVDLEAIASRLGSLFNKAEDAAAFLAEIGGAGWERIARLLVKAGYSAQDIAEYLIDRVGITAERAAEFLKENMALSASAAFNALRGAGVDLDIAANAIADTWEAGAGWIASLMRSAGASASEVAAALIGKFGPGIAGQLFDILTDAGYTASQAYQAINWISSTLSSAANDFFGFGK